MKASLKNNKGFSLIELMVVVAIIGVLATIAIPGVQGYINRARQSEASSNLGVIYNLEQAMVQSSPNNVPFTNNLVTIGFKVLGQANYIYGFTPTDGTTHSIGAAGDPVCDTTPASANACVLTSRAPLGGLVTGLTSGATGAATAATFVAIAQANLRNGGAARVAAADTMTDEWNINQAKILRNSILGL